MGDCDLNVRTSEILDDLCFQFLKILNLADVHLNRSDLPTESCLRSGEV